MRKKKSVFMFLLMISLIFSVSTGSVYAQAKNEVTLNFEGGIIHDGYVEYSNIGKLQLFKGDELVVNISNNMPIDLNEADYKFVIQEIPVEDTGSVVGPAPVKLNINDWYYPMTTIVDESKSTFKLESSKFSSTLDIKLVRIRTVINTRVENIYTDISSNGVIDLTNGKEYVIDFSKTDELTEGLKTFSDLDKILYYKNVNGSLLKTDNESEAVIKIVGNREENKAILTAVNVGNKKSENFKGLQTKYTGSKLQYDGSVDNIINETRTDYYTKCNYDFTFKYANDEGEKIEYEFIEGANQVYIIDESKNATFRIDADYSLFTNKVYVDGKLVDYTNYDSKSGSTVITLKDEYLKTLSVGEHTLKVIFSDNGEAITKFTIKEKSKNEIAQNTENSKNQEQENNNLKNNDVQKDNLKVNPKTGDNVIAYYALYLIALLGIITLVMVSSAKSNRKILGGKENEN